MVAAEKSARSRRRAAGLLAGAALLAGVLIYLVSSVGRGAAERSASPASPRSAQGNAAHREEPAPNPGAGSPTAPAVAPAAPGRPDPVSAPTSPSGPASEASAPPGFGDDEANDVFYEKQIAVHEAGMTAPEGPTPCHTAYNTFWAMHVAFYKYEQVRPSEARYPDGRFRTPWDAITEITEEDYVERCQKLPPEMQKCLTYRYYAQAFDECTAVHLAYVEDLPGRDRDYESVALGMPHLPQHWQGPVRALWQERQKQKGGEQ